MSFRTCSWLLPQKEHRYGTLGPFALPLVVVTCPSRSLLVLGLLRWLGAGSVAGLFGCLRAFAADHASIMRLRDQGTALDRVDRVDDAIVSGVIGSHEIVAVGVADDLLERLAGVAREDLVVALDEVLPFLHLDDRVRRVAAEPARTLVDHDPAVRERVTLALGSGSEQDRRHRGRHADADRAHRCP